MGLDITMAPDAHTCHSGLHGYSSGKALGHQHRQRWQSLVSTWTMDVKIDPGYGGTTDSDMAHGSSPCIDVTMAPGGKQATNISRLLTVFTSLALPLSTAPRPFFRILSHHNGTLPPWGCKLPGWSWCLLASPGLEKPGWPVVASSYLSKITSVGPTHLPTSPGLENPEWPSFIFFFF